MKLKTPLGIRRMRPLSSTSDVWAVPRAESVPRLALARIVDALDNYVDTVALPVTMKRDTISAW